MKQPESQEPQFCENCPMKGDINGPLERIHARSVGSTVTRMFVQPEEVELGIYDVFTDLERNASEPIRLPDIAAKKNPKRALRKALENIKDDIALCDGPDTQPGIIRKKRLYIVGCHALRGLSLEENVPGYIDLEDLEDVADVLKAEARLATYESSKPDFDGELRDLTEE